MIGVRVTVVTGDWPLNTVMRDGQIAARRFLWDRYWTEAFTVRTKRNAHLVIRVLHVGTILFRVGRPAGPLHDSPGTPGSRRSGRSSRMAEPAHRRAPLPFVASTSGGPTRRPSDWVERMRPRVDAIWAHHFERSRARAEARARAARAR